MVEEEVMDEEEKEEEASTTTSRMRTKEKAQQEVVEEEAHGQDGTSLKSSATTAIDLVIMPWNVELPKIIKLKKTLTTLKKELKEMTLYY